MRDPDSLLHVLSARSRVTLPTLREICSALEATSAQNGNADSLRTYKLSRCLDMLGHVEYLQQGRSSAVVVAPACLARLPVIERQVYVLCGARSAAAAEEIGKFTVSGRKVVQVALSSRKGFPDPLLPTRVVVEFEDAEKAQALGAAFGIEVGATAASWSMACLSASCQDFEASLGWRPRTLRNEELKFYDPEKCGFVPSSHDSQGLGMRLDDPSFVCIVRGAQEAVVQDLDWARYWAHAEAGTSCLRYDPARRLFAAPANLPLPRLIARSLALCSGHPPVQTKLRLGFGLDQWLVFRDVPKEISLKVTEKLEAIS